jgi:hypothetical protein|tara:strand:- start:391 stop:1437 length:1047 start_codon:yes stop_codon:yes gene_type:complete
MAKISKATPDNNIPVTKSKHKGIPVTDVASAQAALLAQLQAPASEQPVEEEVQTEVEDNTSEQAMENAESVEAQAEDSNELTVDDLDTDNQSEGNETPQNYTVKVDGKDVEVTLEELQAGYSRQADYTRKSQVLAEQRKQMDDELSATQQERQRYSHALEQLGDSTDFEINQFKDVDWNKLKADDPMAYIQQKDALRDLQDSKNKIAEEKKKLVEQEQKEYEANMMKHRETQIQILSERLPDWVDPTKGPKLKQDIKSFALSKGFSEQEINMLIDARSIEVLNNAMKYENLLNAKIAKKKVKTVPKVTKPGAGVSKAEVDSEKVKQQRARLKRTGKVGDAAKMLEGLI